MRNDWKKCTQRFPASLSTVSFTLVDETVVAVKIFTLISSYLMKVYLKSSRLCELSKRTCVFIEYSNAISELRNWQVASAISDWPTLLHLVVFCLPFFSFRFCTPFHLQIWYVQRVYRIQVKVHGAFLYTYLHTHGVS